MSSISCAGAHKAGLNYIAFNQDATCLALATSAGVRIYNIETHQLCYKYDVGAVG
jgi:hypothetical protein